MPWTTLSITELAILGETVNGGPRPVGAPDYAVLARTRHEMLTEFGCDESQLEVELARRYEEHDISSVLGHMNDYPMGRTGILLEMEDYPSSADEFTVRLFSARTADVRHEIDELKYMHGDWALTQKPKPEGE